MKTFFLNLLFTLTIFLMSCATSQVYDFATPNITQPVMLGKYIGFPNVELPKDTILVGEIKGETYEESNILYLTGFPIWWIDKKADAEIDFKNALLSDTSRCVTSLSFIVEDKFYGYPAAFYNYGYAGVSYYGKAFKIKK